MSIYRAHHLPYGRGPKCFVNANPYYDYNCVATGMTQLNRPCMLFIFVMLDHILTNRVSHVKWVLSS